MKYTLKTALYVALFCNVFVACNNASQKTTETTKTDSSVTKLPDGPFAVQKMMAGKIQEYAAYSVQGNGQPQQITIQFGSQTNDTIPVAIPGCQPGPGICNVVQKLGGPGTPDTSLVVAGTFYMYMFKANIQSSNPALYRALNSANFNGVLTWPNDYTVPASIAESMGATQPITITKGSPMAFTTPINPQMGDIVLFPVGAMPGNQAWMSLSNCVAITDSTTGVTLSFSPTQAGSAAKVFTSFGVIPGSTLGFLAVYMNTSGLLSQPGICPTCLPCQPPSGVGASVLGTATTYTFSDSATAASMSVPQNSTISNGGFMVTYFSGGWCEIVFNVTIPEGAAATLKSNAAKKK